MYKNYNKKIIFRKLICIAFAISIIFSSIYIFEFFYAKYNIQKYKYLIDDTSISQELPKEDNHTVTENISSEETLESDDFLQKTERMLKLEELQKQNSDIKAWIEIENTDINYPVLQAQDNNYYMKHNYKKEYSKNGSIFLDKSYSWDPPSSNLLIYGHNNKNNTMFQSLLKYKQENYYKNHPFIRFTTNNEDVYYEIIAVFESRVYYKNEQNVFRYYYFINSKNEQDYNDFVQNAKKSSLYDTGKTAQYGEQLMTLSTCAYHTEDGRFVVVAKKAL